MVTCSSVAASVAVVIVDVVLIWPYTMVPVWYGS